MTELINARDAARLLGCSTTAVVRMTQAGLLTPVERVGKHGRPMFDPAAIERYASTARRRWRKRRRGAPIEGATA